MLRRLSARIGPDLRRLCYSDKVAEETLLIHKAHLEACKKRNDTYEDPYTSYTVISLWAHLQRKKCCGSCCRHCPYGHKNVPELQRTKRFNCYFYE